MAEYITLTCPSCGSKLNITENIDRFACIHCGNEHIVNRGDGIVTISPIVEGLEKVQRGTDKTASELAIVRLNKEIAELEQTNQKKTGEAGVLFIVLILVAFFIILLPIIWVLSFDTLMIFKFIGLGVIILSIIVGFNLINQFKNQKIKSG